MGIVRKVVAVIWFILAPCMVAYFVVNFLELLKATEQEWGGQVMIVLFFQIFCILLIMLARFAKLLIKVGGSEHVTTIGIILDLVIAPIKLAYFWCIYAFRVIVFILKKFFSLLFGRSGSSKSSGRESAAAVAEPRGYEDPDRERGSDGKLRSWIRNALPGGCPSWPYGHAYVDSKTVELSSMSNTILLGARIHFNYIGSLEGAASNRSELQSSIQSVGEEYANKMLHAASSAFEQFREKYYGYDGEWGIKISNIDVKMDLSSS